MQKMELRYRWEYDNEERSLRIPITQFILYFACYCWSVQGIRSDLNWRIIIMIVISAGSRDYHVNTTFTEKDLSVRYDLSVNFPFLFFSFLFFMIYLFFIFFVFIVVFVVIVVIFSWLFMFTRMAVVFAIVFALWRSAENDTFKITLFKRCSRIVVK